MKATGFAWFHLRLTLLLLTSYWCLQVNGDCLKAKCTFSEGDGQCGPSCRCYSDPENPTHPTIGVCAPHYETTQTSQQPDPGSGQGAYYGGGAGMGNVASLTYGLTGAMQNRQYMQGAIQPGTAQSPQAPASPASSPNSPSTQPTTASSGTASANKPPVPPKPAGTQQSPPQRPPLPPKPAGSPQSPPQRPPPPSKPAGTPQSPPQRPSLPPKPAGTSISRPQRPPLPPPRPVRPAPRPLRRPILGGRRPFRWG